MICNISSREKQLPKEAMLCLEQEEPDCLTLPNMQRALTGYRCCCAVALKEGLGKLLQSFSFFTLLPPTVQSSLWHLQREKVQTDGS